MSTSVWYRLLLMLACAVGFCLARDVDRRCFQGNCVVLSVADGKVLARRTGEFTGEREIGHFVAVAAPLVPTTEAPIVYASTRNGWRVVVSAYLPKEFDYAAPELRIHIVSPLRSDQTIIDDYNSLGSLHIGPLLGPGYEFVQVSTTGEHSYVVRTRVWLLPQNGGPDLVLDLPGALVRIDAAGAAHPPGLCIDRETYDGVHADTKGQIRELWVWDAGTRHFKRNRNTEGCRQ